MTRRHTAEETKEAMHLIVGEMYDRIVKGEPPTMTLPAGNTPTDVTLGIAASYAAQTVVYQTLPPDTLVDDGHRTIPLRTPATEE